MKTLMAAVVAAMTFGASAEMTIDLDLKAKPIKEMKSPEDGRAQRGGSETGYGDNKRTTARGAAGWARLTAGAEKYCNMSLRERAGC